MDFVRKQYKHQNQTLKENKETCAKSEKFIHRYKIRPTSQEELYRRYQLSDTFYPNVYTSFAHD